jgi:hypothetical protein
MDGVDAATKAALALGAFGSLLGLLNFAVKAVEVWRDKPTLSLDISVRSNILDIRLVNAGRRPVTIDQIGLRYTSGEEVCSLKDLPAELGEGQVLTRSMRFVMPDGEAPPSGSPSHYFARPATGRPVDKPLPKEAVDLVSGRVLRETEIFLV